MGDGTRAATGSTEAAGAFAAFVIGWLEDYAPLVEALFTLRVMGAEQQACEALLGVPEMSSFRESWEVWDLWADQTPAESDERLAPFLGCALVGALRFALWG